MRAHQARGRAGTSSGGEDTSSGRDPRQMAMMKRQRERRQAKAEEEAGGTQASPALAEARHKLRDKVTHGVKETCYAALDVFQSMVRADERKDAEVDGAFSQVIAEKVTDFLSDKAVEVASETLELGETVVGGPVAAVFGAAKGQLESMASLDQKMKASEAVDRVVATSRETIDRATQVAGAAVDAISDEKMAEIAGVLEQFQGVSGAADGDDEGELKRGLENWAMEQLLGAPRTGGAAIHEEAVQLYETYRAEVAKGEPASEQADDAQAAMSGQTHQEGEDGARSAEKRLGLEKEVERDTVERERTRE